MKTIIAFLCLLAFIQAEPDEITQKIEVAVGECVSKLHLKKETLTEKMNLPETPEDEEDLPKFYECVGKRIGIVTSNGDIDFEKLHSLTEGQMKEILGDVPDVDSKAHQFSVNAIEHCKGTPKIDNAGVTTIRVHNCMKRFLHKNAPR